MAGKPRAAELPVPVTRQPECQGREPALCRYREDSSSGNITLSKLNVESKHNFVHFF